MAVTPNYGWPVPVATDLVKDGYEAIADLGDAIDATVHGLGDPGLVLIKTQTIGTTVSSVQVTGAFSATFNNYKITVSGGVASSNQHMNITLGSTATGYYNSNSALTFAGAGATTGFANQTSFRRTSLGTTDTLTGNIDLQNPFNAKFTTISYVYLFPNTSGEAGFGAGFLNDVTSYTAFTLTPASGTYTGGTIAVYGYAI